MAILVHLAPEKLGARFLKSGIRKGVYCMPLLPNYYASHQWLRELKRGGQRAHGKRPTCDCPLCLPRGSIKSKKLRERIRS